MSYKDASDKYSVTYALVYKKEKALRKRREFELEVLKKKRSSKESFAYESKT